MISPPGNTTSGGGRTNTWDSQNRLDTCTLNGTTSDFDYGADGLRRRMTVTTGGVSTPTDYAYYATMPIREFHHVNNDVSQPLTNFATYFQ